MHDSIQGTQNEAPILRERHICNHLDNTTTVVLQKAQTHSKQSHMLGKTFGHFQKNMA